MPTLILTIPNLYIINLCQFHFCIVISMVIIEIKCIFKLIGPLHFFFCKLTNFMYYPIYFYCLLYSTNTSLLNVIKEG